MLKLTVHTKGLEAIKDKLAQGCTKAEHTVAMQIKSDTADYVPASQDMQLNTHTFVRDNLVIYDRPYAHYLYVGKLYVDPETGSSYAPKGATKVATNKDLVFSLAKHPQAQSHWFEASKAENLEKWVRVADKAVKDDL